MKPTTVDLGRGLRGGGLKHESVPYGVFFCGNGVATIAPKEDPKWWCAVLRVNRGTLKSYFTIVTTRKFANGH